MTPRKRVQRQSAATLPLFGNGPEIGFRRRPSDGASDAEAQVLSIYWSALLHAHALGAAAAVARYPSEREALNQLLALELERKEAARRLLRDVWGVGFLGSPAPEAPRAA